MLQLQLCLTPHLPRIKSVLPQGVKVDVVHKEGTHGVDSFCRDWVLYHRAKVELFEDVDKNHAKLDPLRRRGSVALSQPHHVGEIKRASKKCL